MKKPFSCLALLFLLLGSCIAEPAAASADWLTGGVEAYRFDSNAAGGGEGPDVSTLRIAFETILPSEDRAASVFVVNESRRTLKARHFDRTWHKTGPPDISS